MEEYARAMIWFFEFMERKMRKKGKEGPRGADERAT
jgi:hypothetical protein